MPLDEKITPDCCEEAKKHKTVFLQHPCLKKGTFEDYNISKEGLKEKPSWVTWDYLKEWHGHTTADCLYCPYCGEELPDIQLRENVEEKICTFVDGGYYCDTCDKRLNECECRSFEYVWEPCLPQ